jgi:protein O-mannosyl-transferase
MSRKPKKPLVAAATQTQRQACESAEETNGWRSPTVWAVCCFLVFAVAFVFAQTLGHEFINYDDNIYVYENPRVAHGFESGWLTWAVTSNQCNNWHPLTWLSHTLDAQLFGVHPGLEPWKGPEAGLHHLTSLLLHAAAAVALFLVLRRMTGDLWCSALAAAVFAIHPLRVESVAWVAERKDVLSGLIFMLTLGAYAGYVRRSFSWARYLTVVGCFALGLTAKPMLVTLPFALLLLDYWPLRRMSFTPSAEDAVSAAVPLGRLIVEKIPLFVLSAASCVVTIWAQGSAIQPLDLLPIDARIGNAAVSYVAYLGQMFYPADLAVIYPSRGTSLAAWQVAGAFALLAAITGVVVVLRRKCPYLLVGWLWYLGMLVPAIGLVQVGSQAMADRYTYLPQIGLYVAIAWGVAQLTRSWPHRVFACGAVSAIVMAALLLAARVQASYWLNSETLYTHALACNPRNVIVLSNLGIDLVNRGYVNKGIEQYETAIAIDPNGSMLYLNLGKALLMQRRYAEAVERSKQALAIDPRCADALFNLGESLRLSGNYDAAIAHFERSLELKPNRADAYVNLGAAYGQKGMVPQAIEQFRKALAIEPEKAEAHRNLGVALLDADRVNEALAEFRLALHFATLQGNREVAEASRAKIQLIESHQTPR